MASRQVLAEVAPDLIPPLLGRCPRCREHPLGVIQVSEARESSACALPRRCSSLRLAMSSRRRPRWGRDRSLMIDIKYHVYQSGALAKELTSKSTVHDSGGPGRAESRVDCHGYSLARLC